MNFTGTGVAIITPFKTDYSVDFNALEKIVENLINNKINYLVVLGTTSEAATLTDNEKNKVVNFIKKVNNNRLPIVLGMGGNNTQKLVETIKQTDFSGIDAILSVAPYYNKPNQKGIYKHYKQIAENSPVPIILYNVPGRTSSKISADTCLQLAHDFKNIAAIKEASADFAEIMKIIQNKPEGFEVISGDDALTLPLISIGMKGVISVIANAFPRRMSNMVNFALNNEITKAKKIHYEILEMINFIFTEGNPAGIKNLLSQMDMCEDILRLPLTEISNDLSVKIGEKLKIIEEV